MGITREQVISRMRECDEIGPSEFLDRFGFQEPRGVYLWYRNKKYPARALWAASHNPPLDTTWHSSLMWHDPEGAFRRLDPEFDLRMMETDEPTNMGIKDVLNALRPTKKLLVFDLAAKAGLNVDDWIASSKDPRGYKANPKYCYEWSFVEPGQVVILNLWHEAMTIEDGEIVQRGNFRADALSHQGRDGKPQWLARATKLDDALQTALRDNLPVRVIINSGKRRIPGDPAAKASQVLQRELDSKPWTIVEYDWQTGDHAIRRGITDNVYVDQFDLDQSDKADPRKRQQTSSTYIRDPKVRDHVKRRSQGRCEYCGDVGFMMAGGAVYLETHHIIPLSEGGVDTLENVIALCPLDHRRAHYAHDASELRGELTNAINQLLSRP